MEQFKSLEVISGAELTFGRCLTGADNMKANETSLQVKEAMIRMKKTKQTFSEGKENTLWVMESTIWYILKKK